MAANSNFAVAVHAMTVLAYNDELVKSETIAKSININPVIVRKLLTKLVKAGLVQSLAGKKGGFALGKSAEKVTLFEILNAVETTEIFAIPKHPTYQVCPVSCHMKDLLSRVFQSTEHAVEEELSKVTLNDLLTQIP